MNDNQGDVEVIVRTNGKEGKSRIQLEALLLLESLHGNEARKDALSEMFVTALKDCETT